MRMGLRAAAIWMLISAIGCAPAPQDGEVVVASADPAPALELEEPVWLYTLAAAHSPAEAWERPPQPDDRTSRSHPDPIAISPEPEPSPPAGEMKMENTTPVSRQEADRTTREEKSPVRLADSNDGLKVIRLDSDRTADLLPRDEQPMTSGR
jgi:hypothetical protein